MQFSRIGILLLLIVSSARAADTFDNAVSAFERGDYASAEAILHVLLEKQPNNFAAAGLLGPVLDSQQKYAAAETAYRRALHLSPASATLLNNYANHQLSTGNASGARASYLKVIALDPARANANLQLASMAADQNQGDEALRYLAHLSPQDRSTPQVEILEMRALYLSGRSKEAEVILADLSPASASDPRVSFTAGLALAALHKYNEAEALFSRALEGAQANFDVLYNLGLAAYHAGHLDRAHDVLESALAQRPNDVDTLYSLATVDIDLKQRQAALRLLGEAARLDASRANVQLALAQTASALGFYADARLSYEKYLKLAPADEAAQREHDFMVAASLEPREGLASLQRYVQSHPKDATARYEVGLLEAKADPADAAVQFDKALALQADFAPARLGRGVVNLLNGNPDTALPDLEFAATRYPDNSSVLDRLGETYTALNRADDAVRTLRKASEIAPRDGRVLMHLSRALMKAGRTEDARAVLVRFRAVGPQSGNLIPLPGFVDFLSLTPEQQEARYREELEKRLSKDPNDPALNARYLKLLASEGKTQEVAAAAARLLALAPPAPLAAEAGHALVETEHYADAKPLLHYALKSAQTTAAQVDLALTEFRTGGPKQGLEELDQIPGSQRSAEYFLARAQMLEADGNEDSALASLQSAVKLAPKRPELYAAEASLLAKLHRQADALQLLDEALGTSPDHPELLLVKADILASNDRRQEAELVFKHIESRWPEWAPAYQRYGALLQSENRAEEAKLQLDTATALGSTQPQ